MKIAVKDANVLIDMAEADLLGLWFSLAIPTHTTDLVLDEVEQTGQRSQIVPFVSDNQLHIHSVTSADMIKTAILANDHGISPADASALLLSKRLKAVLLTGDGRLRKVASLQTVEVRGVLWVFDHLVEKGLLSSHDAARRLKHLRSAGSFLPADQCDERIANWVKR